MTEPTSTPAKEVWITGIGIVSSLGEGLDAHWDALNAKRVNTDEKGFAPYVVHPFAPVNFDAQIPKKGDQRQMEAWQRIGTYAAGLALDSAGVKGNQEILSRMDMIVAAGGGQRDIALVGAAHNGERQDLLVLYEFGDFNLRGKYAPLWTRDQAHGGFALG